MIAALLAILPLMLPKGQAADRPQIGCAVDAFPGTAGSLTASEALQSFGRTYSAAATLDQHIFPRLMSEDLEEGGTFYMSYDGLYKVAELPGMVVGTPYNGDPGELCPSPMGVGWYDVSSYNLAFAGRYHWVTFWYAANNTSGLETENGLARGMLQTTSFLSGHIFAGFAPLIGSRTWQLTENSQMRFDWMGGVGIDAKVAALNVGYVGSEGLMVDLRQPQTRLFAQSIVDIGKQRDIGQSLLRYFKGGARGLQLPGDETRKARVGGLDLLATSYRLTTSSGREQALSDFRAGTIQHRNIWEIGDLGLTYALAPVARVYEWHLGAHTPGFHSDLASDLGDGVEGAAGFFIGSVNLPEQRWYGQEGGSHLYVNLEGRLIFDDYDRDGQVRFQLKRNDPDTLAVFPFAQDSWSAHLSFQISYF